VIGDQKNDLMKNKLKYILPIFVILFAVVGELAAQSDQNAPPPPPPPGDGDEGGCEVPPDPTPLDFGYIGGDCSNSATLTITYHDPPSEYAHLFTWYKGSTRIGRGARLGISQSGTYHLYTENTCSSDVVLSYNYKAVNVTIERPPAAPLLPNVTENECGDKYLSYNPDEYDGDPEWHWQDQDDQGQDYAPVDAADYRVTESGYYYIRSKRGTCWGSVKEVYVDISEKAEPPVFTSDAYVRICGSGTALFTFSDPNFDQTFNKIEMQSDDGLPTERFDDSYSRNFSTSGVYQLKFRIINENNFTCPSNWVFATVEVISSSSGGRIKSSNTGGDQRICAGTIPEKLVNDRLATGGNGNFSYKWKFSVNGGNWDDAPTMHNHSNTDPNEYIFIEPIDETTRVKREATSTSCDGANTATSTIVYIHVSDVESGSIESPVTESICYGENPGQIRESSPPQGGDGENYSFKWYKQKEGDEGWGDPVGFDENYSPGTLEITTSFKRKVTSCGISSFSDIVTIDVKEALSTPALGELEYTTCIGENKWIELEKTLEGYTYEWKRSGQTAGSGNRFNLSPFDISSGIFNVSVTGSLDGCSTESLDLTVHVLESCDDMMNWIQQDWLDQNGLYRSQKVYYDLTGRMIQKQVKNLSLSNVLVNGVISGKHDRVVLNTLSAPSGISFFSYNTKFISHNNKKYNYENFDLEGKITNPDPIQNTIEGSLGWYYSENNTWEENVPVTAYPYSRKQFYTDGSGEVKKAGAPGEVLRIGGGHVSKAGTYSVTNELEEYFDIREQLYPGFTTSTDHLNSEAVVSLGRDRNGHYSFSVADRGERVLMSASYGVDEIIDQVKTNELLDGSLSDFVYFYLTVNSPITYSGTTSFSIRNMMNDDPLGKPASLAPGFYRAEVVSGKLTLTYTVKFGDASYNYYDNAGRLLCSISPNGLEQYRAGVALDKIDKTTYTYNHQGWLLSTTEPDAGTTEYMYRKDGSIRFSQNSKQKKKGLYGSFSFTNYDPLGRPIMSGEFEPKSGNQFNSFNNVALRGILENTTRKGGLWNDPPPGAQPLDDFFVHDRVSTFYDEAVTQIPNLPVEYKQEFVMGAVSYTNNDHITTWYSYDEQGRVTWKAQKPDGMDRTFLMEYEYDFLGNVLRVDFEAYQATGIKEQFYHYYTYDADKRLSSVYTSTEELPVDNIANNDLAQLQAHYEYYMHGPLKRVELGGNMQGIDFVYDINGWLQSINNPDDLTDEAGFMDDAFSLLLNYYNNDMSSLFSIAHLDPAPKPNLFHQLPADMIHNKTDIAQLMELYRPFVMEPIIDNQLKQHSAEQPMYKEKLQNLKENVDASQG